MSDNIISEYISFDISGSLQMFRYFWTSGIQSECLMSTTSYKYCSTNQTVPYFPGLWKSSEPSDTQNAQKSMAFLLSYISFVPSGMADYNSTTNLFSVACEVCIFSLNGYKSWILRQDLRVFSDNDGTSNLISC
jgi:hypothetical protein